MHSEYKYNSSAETIAKESTSPGARGCAGPRQCTCVKPWASCTGSSHLPSPAKGRCRFVGSNCRHAGSALPHEATKDASEMTPRACHYAARSQGRGSSVTNACCTLQATLRIGTLGFCSTEAMRCCGASCAAGAASPCPTRARTSKYTQYLIMLSGSSKRSCSFSPAAMRAVSHYVEHRQPAAGPHDRRSASCLVLHLFTISHACMHACNAGMPCFWEHAADIKEQHC